jgi:antitoxin ParD1/3/4
MNVSLTAELEKYVRRKVASGLYNNASEVIRKALRLHVENETRCAREAVAAAWTYIARAFWIGSPQLSSPRQ